MRIQGDAVLLSATDVSNALACRHLTQLDRAVIEGRLSPPSWRDPSLELLQERGLAHEKAYIEHLRASGLSIDEPPADAPATFQRTVAAMRAGTDAIVQADLREGRWIGRADVLLKVAEPSDLGDWSYEVVDTKLSQETRAGTVLQLCLYSEIVGRAQGMPPSLMHVVKPGPGLPRESFRFGDFSAYFRLVQRRLSEAAAAAPPPPTYPTPVAHCDVCRWWKECDARRHVDDNLCLVAGIRPLHASELERQGILTLEQFAEEPKPLREKPLRGSPEAFARAHGQARIQLSGRRAGRQVYELLEPEPDSGLTRLAEPDKGDIFFDIEADPFAGEGGLEYLFGLAFAGNDGSLTYKATWAFDRIQERKALEWFMDLVMDRWEAYPGMHVYHFSPYEPGAVKRLVGRHGTREAELDRLLRAGRFVDLYAVTRRGLRVSVESYSLKSLEESYGFARAKELREAGAALRRIDRCLELGVADEISKEDRAAVEMYNRDDCFSTAALRGWLEERRSELVAQGHAVPRPAEETGEPASAVQEKAAEVQRVYDLLVSRLPQDRERWGPSDRAAWLLANQLEYFHREDRCAWWEFFRIQEMDAEELREERKAIAGLRFMGPSGSKGPRVHRYSFPEQEAAFDPGNILYEVGGESIGTVHSIDLQHGVLEIEKYVRSLDVHPAAVMVNDRVTPKPVDGSLLSFASSVAEKGVDGNGPYRAGRDLLLRNPPRLRESDPGPLRKTGERIVDAAVRLVRGMDGGCLPIQGPPGTGKTYTGARMILALASEGKRIGVTAVSHKVIRNLLQEVMNAARKEGARVGAIHKVSKLSPEGAEAWGEAGALGAIPLDRAASGAAALSAAASAAASIEETTDNSEARKAVRAGRIVGGTAWFWSRDEMAESVDYLFVDEAGQMSLAHALAAGRSARNLVLLGDPQQLEQPQRGAHPEGAEVAALVHILGGSKTISDERGLFLDETWRLHPKICGFVSELCYEGRLFTRPGLSNQGLSGTSFTGSGLFYVPVDHQGNQNHSAEEVEAVGRIVEELLAKGSMWTDKDRQVNPLCIGDILVVAPYNAHVAALVASLPQGARVGTVDRFQGQEAPVVIYSMASSSAADAPRGMSFLYSTNRLNVAASRARCATILVAAPRLLEPECGTPDQMRLANGLCRYRELAVEVAR